MVLGQLWVLGQLFILDHLLIPDQFLLVSRLVLWVLRTLFIVLDSAVSSFVKIIIYVWRVIELGNDLVTLDPDSSGNGLWLVVGL